MARNYYIFKNGRLSRKGNTLYFEKSEEVDGKQRKGSVPQKGVGIQSATFEFEEEESLPSMTLQEDGTARFSEVMTDPDIESADPDLLSPQDTDPISDKTHIESADPDLPPTGELSSSSGERRPIPVEDVDQLFLFGEVTINTKLLNFLAKRGIPMHIFNYYGFYSGTYYPRETNVSGHLLVKQVEHCMDPAKRLVIAREIVQGAYHNLHRNLLYYRNRGKAVEEAVEVLEVESRAIEGAHSIPELMGAEGRMRDAYYRAFNEILKLETPFLKRVKRPPDNMINALISFGNSLLYSVTLSQIYRTPLNPTISYLHEPGTRRFTLALDISEIFKPIIVDKMIFKLVNKQMITEEDLMEEVEFAYLKERGRKVVVQEFEERLRTTVKHRRLGRNVSYRGFIRLECYKLVRHLLGIEPYRALRAWW
jgi:CRISPR-associated protein Cas1